MIYLKAEYESFLLHRISNSSFSQSRGCMVRKPLGNMGGAGGGGYEALLGVSGIRDNEIKD